MRPLLVFFSGHGCIGGGHWGAKEMLGEPDGGVASWERS